MYLRIAKHRSRPSFSPRVLSPALSPARALFVPGNVAIVLTQVQLLWGVVPFGAWNTRWSAVMGLPFRSR